MRRTADHHDALVGHQPARAILAEERHLQALSLSLRGALLFTHGDDNICTHLNACVSSQVLRAQQPCTRGLDQLLRYHYDRGFVWGLERTRSPASSPSACSPAANCAIWECSSLPRHRRPVNTRWAQAYTGLQHTAARRFAAGRHRARAPCQQARP